VLYKIQLRFSTAANTDNNVQWYADNIEKFSEWSTVCIIKPIVVPIFYIDDFYVEEDQNNSTTGTDEDENNFFSNLADFVGIYKRSYTDSSGNKQSSS